MNDSNFYILACYRLKRSEQEKRLQYLENSIQQLKQYHKKAHPGKKPVVRRLLLQYELLFDKLTLGV